MPIFLCGFIPIFSKPSLCFPLNHAVSFIPSIVSINLFGSFEKGLKVKAKKDMNDYKKGIKVSDEEMDKINLIKDEFKGKWNYKITKQM